MVSLGTALLIALPCLIGYGVGYFVAHWTQENRLQAARTTIRRLESERAGYASAHQAALARVRRLEAERAEVEREAFFGPRVMFGPKADLRVVRGESS